LPTSPAKLFSLAPAGNSLSDSIRMRKLPSSKLVWR